MKKSSLALMAILAVASFTMLFIAEAPSGSEPRLPAYDPQAIAQTVQKDNSEPDEIRSPSIVGEVVFPHLEHVDDFGMECQECHHEINAAPLNMPHEEYFEDFWIECGVCHSENGDAPKEAVACSECHHDRPSGIADQTLSSKVAIHKNCWDCHEVGTGAEASGECTFCHSGEKLTFTPPASDQ